MRDWLAKFRGLAGRDDRAAAFRAERVAVSRATELPAVDPRFRAEMTAQSRAPADSIPLGTSLAEPDLQARLPITDIVGSGHGLVLGGTGSGKTRLVAGFARELLVRIARRPDSLGLVVIDHKSELAALVREIVGELVSELPPVQAERLLDRLVVIDPFSTSKLIPMQILRPEPGVAAELQAFEVTSLIDRLGGADLGVRQDAFMFHLALLGILGGLSLPALARLTSDPIALASFAARSSSGEVRAYFSGGPRVAPASLEGVKARLHRLLRLPATRMMLGARDSISFHSLLSSKIVIADVGSPPLGCEDLARFWSGLLTLKMSRAIFERSPEEATRPVAILVDEWQEGLAAGGDAAGSYERLLSMARSRGVSMWLISQSLAGAARVSSSLPKVVATNTNLQLLFRAAPEDARAMIHLLPVTGRRPRPAPPPWEEKPRSPYLSAAEEREFLISEVPSLPDRVFYLWNRRRPYRAELVRALEVSPKSAPFRSAAVSERLATGILAVPIAELERQVRAEDTPAAPADIATEPVIAPRPSRRPRRSR